MCGPGLPGGEGVSGKVEVLNTGDVTSQECGFGLESWTMTNPRS